MTDFVCSIHWLHTPSWIDFGLIFPPVEADSSLAVLDFFLAHRAVPYVLCTSWHGLFTPRGIARSEIRFAWIVRKKA